MENETNFDEEYFFKNIFSVKKKFLSFQTFKIY